MRWGISQEANIDHSTSEICLNEIRNSKKDSIGPYFVVRNVFLDFESFFICNLCIKFY
jgi:hypothetical protein